MMAEILAIFIAAVSGLIIVIPLFIKKDGLEDTRDDEVNSLKSKKESLYQTIKDIEFEYVAGKIDEKNYQDLRERLENQAAIILKKIEQTPSSQFKHKEIENKVEKEIEKLKVQDKNDINKSS